jgi:cyclophilin family peptidyl-prolyl cis-trans isomerase/HEAT repeat protein
MRIIFFLILLAACGTKQRDTPNRWSDERLWPVLEAQERRETEALCALLKHEAPEVREAAALAFASIQDTAAMPCLLAALRDEHGLVRTSAAYALGYVADSAALEVFAEIVKIDSNAQLLAANHGASFIARQRIRRLNDPDEILRCMEAWSGHQRARAADALRRLPDSVLFLHAERLVKLLSHPDPEVRSRMALSMRKLGTRADTSALRALALGDKDRMVRVNAIRACAVLNCITDEELFGAARTPELRSAGLEALSNRETLDPLQCLFHQKDAVDQALGIALLGLAAKHASQESADGLCEQLTGYISLSQSPYNTARAVSTLISAQCWLDLEQVLDIVKGTDHPTVRQAALEGAILIVRKRMKRSRFASREAQYAELASVLAAAIRSGDAGLISAAAEVIEQEDADVIRILLPSEVENEAFAPLQPIRDLEARLLLQKAITKRDGLPPPAHQRPPFNHPIDKAKLLALKQGQQYRIVTSKGEVIIATDVNECPGSSLAFDSLVVAGYYNGKAFHRMVPNFVVQGGCPRGDGYGGMPWTLRTEIGRTPFTAGSVGLASAGPDTESCQFFITHSAAPHLDGRYTRFGAVVSGMDVVWKLQVGDVMERVKRLP